MALTAATAGLLSAGITGVFSAFGASRANRQRRREAERNRRFQERMSSSAHQREVADLRKAGLNPILSATGGRGAASPGGSMAQQQDVVTPAIGSALSARRLTSELKLLKAQTYAATTAGLLSDTQSAKSITEAHRIATETAIRKIDLVTLQKYPWLRPSQMMSQPGAAVAGSAFAISRLFKRGKQVIRPLRKYVPQ